jgi:hypothetical protein
VAVPQALFEELRTHLAYECVDVTALPAVGTASVTTTVGTVSAATAGSAPNGYRTTRLHGSTTNAGGCAQPAATTIAVVAQVLGELKVDEKDNEWMYAVGGNGAIPHGAAGQHAPQLSYTTDLHAAASKAKALLLGCSAGADIESIDLDSSAGTPLTSGRPDHQTPRAARLPLDVNNRAFVLAADVVRARRRADDAARSAGGVPSAEAEASVEAVRAQLAGILADYPANLSVVAAAIFAIVAS